MFAPSSTLVFYVLCVSLHVSRGFFAHCSFLQVKFYCDDHHLKVMPSIFKILTVSSKLSQFWLHENSFHFSFWQIILFSTCILIVISFGTLGSYLWYFLTSHAAAEISAINLIMICSILCLWEETDGSVVNVDHYDVSKGNSFFFFNKTFLKVLCSLRFSCVYIMCILLVINSILQSPSHTCCSPLKSPSHIYDFSCCFETYWL